MSRLLRLGIALFIALAASLAGAGPAMAQTRYTNTADSTTGGINKTAAPCSSRFTRTFFVGTSFTVSDVDIGVLAAHVFRGDMVMYLVHPDGTRVQLTAGSGSNSAKNFNALFNDEATAGIATYTAAATATASTAVPPYAASFQPATSLSAFDGKNAAGTWTLEICDQFTGDSGTFFQADLYLTSGAVAQADLSLSVGVNTAAPLPGTQVIYSMTVSNAGSSAATASGITVRGALPASFIYRGFTGPGSYDPATGAWTVGTLAPGASATIQVSGANNSSSGSTFAFAAQITGSSVSDPDSVVGNGVTTEDDYGSVSFTTAALPAAGIPPAFTCPITTNLFDWDAQSWTTGGLSRAFTVGGIAMNLAITGATSRFVADPATGSATPVRNQSSTGGATGQNALMLAVDMASASESVTATWTFTGGVGGLRFTMADIDLFHGQFVDRVTVTGSYNGVSVVPILTAGQTNSVSGNTATATALADNAAATGNLIVSFDRPVDTVTINYGPDAATSPANPGIQAIALMDMNFCSRATDLSLAKTVSDAAPAPGSAISYTLSVANTTVRAMSATGVAVRDVLPAGFTFASATGTGSYNSGTGVWTIGNLAAGATATLTINGTVSAAVGATVTNIAQITASSLPDPDSVVNNGVTSEDDYAAVAFTVPSTITCPTGSSATGSGFATSGSGANLNRIFWLDWSCGGTASFPAGSTVNKTWTAGDGLVITGQITGLTAAVRPYVTGSWGGDILDDLYAGLNPIGLRNTIDGDDPQFSLALSATLNGSPVSLRYVMADAEDSGGAISAESIQATTSGSLWNLLESAGSISFSSTGSTVTIHDPANAGGGTVILETTASALSMNITLMGGGGTAAAFGFHTPYDWSDGPTTGTAFGAANHRTIPGFGLGPAVTAETAAYNSADASADAADDGVALPDLTRGVPATIPVSVSGNGYLSAWIDFNGDGDFADAGEQIAAGAVDGGTGDGDGAANGVILLAVTPPADAVQSPTIARFRFASISGSSISGLYGFGEVEDYGLTILRPGLTVTKIGTVLSDPVNGTSDAKAIPGAVVEYCILITNSGTATAGSIAATDAMPATTSYIAGSLTSGPSCAAATVAEDDDATGPDESDPFGAAVSGSTITATAGTLPASSSLAVKYRATVN